MSRLSNDQKRDIQFKLLNHLIAKEKVIINPSASYIKQLTRAQQANNLINQKNNKKLSCNLLCSTFVLVFVSLIIIYLFMKTFDNFSILILKNKNKIAITFSIE